MLFQTIGTQINTFFRIFKQPAFMAIQNVRAFGWKTIQSTARTPAKITHRIFDIVWHFFSTDNTIADVRLWIFIVHHKEFIRITCIYSFCLVNMKKKALFFPLSLIFQPETMERNLFIWSMLIVFIDLRKNMLK